MADHVQFPGTIDSVPMGQGTNDGSSIRAYLTNTGICRGVQLRTVSSPSGKTEVALCQTGEGVPIGESLLAPDDLTLQFTQKHERTDPWQFFGDRWTIKMTTRLVVLDAAGLVVNSWDCPAERPALGSDLLYRDGGEGGPELGDTPQIDGLEYLGHPEWAYDLYAEGYIMGALLIPGTDWVVPKLSKTNQIWAINYKTGVIGRLKGWAGVPAAAAAYLNDENRDPENPGFSVGPEWTYESYSVLGWTGTHLLIQIDRCDRTISRASKRINANVELDYLDTGGKVTQDFNDSWWTAAGVAAGPYNNVANATYVNNEAGANAVIDRWESDLDDLFASQIAGNVASTVAHTHGFALLDLESMTVSQTFLSGDTPEELPEVRNGLSSWVKFTQSGSQALNGLWVNDQLALESPELLASRATSNNLYIGQPADRPQTGLLGGDSGITNVTPGPNGETFDWTSTPNIIVFLKTEYDVIGDSHFNVSRTWDSNNTSRQLWELQPYRPIAPSSAGGGNLLGWTSYNYFIYHQGSQGSRVPHLLYDGGNFAFNQDLTRVIFAPKWNAPFTNEFWVDTLFKDGGFDTEKIAAHNAKNLVSKKIKCFNVADWSLAWEYDCLDLVGSLPVLNHGDYIGSGATNHRHGLVFGSLVSTSTQLAAIVIANGQSTLAGAPAATRSPNYLVTLDINTGELIESEEFDEDPTVYGSLRTEDLMIAINGKLIGKSSDRRWTVSQAA